jgi:hypothetical protein
MHHGWKMEMCGVTDKLEKQVESMQKKVMLLFCSSAIKLIQKKSLKQDYFLFDINLQCNACIQKLR